MRAMITLFIFTMCIIMQGANASNPSVAARHGMRYFYEHCSGCHTLRYLPASWENHDAMVDMRAIRQGSVTKQQALRWFGTQPPDLSLIVNQRGKFWIKQYLTGFYYDATRPFFANNRWLPNTAMPDVLYPYVADTHTLDELLVFLTEVAEPDRTQHYRIGFVVIACIAMLWWLLHRLTADSRAVPSKSPL